MQIDYYQLDAALRAISAEYPEIPDKVKSLIKYKGLPGFVQEFKNLKSWALQILSGKKDFKVEWFRSEVYLGYTIPKRYKRVFRHLVEIQSLVNLKPELARTFVRDLTMLLSILNLYHIVRGPYRPDMVKQVASATQKEVIPQKVSFWKEGLRLACYAVTRKLPSNLGQLRPTGQTLSLKPGSNGTWGAFVAREAFLLLAGFDHELTIDKLKRRLKYLTPTNHMGNLTFLGETGGKTRTVLVANPILQSQLSVLKDALLDLLRFIPTDTLWDQSRGVEFLKKALQSGQTVYSVDLKDATWNFPRLLQEELLSKLGVKRKVRDLLFRTLVYNPLDKKSYLVEKGQAMGLGPSFPLFSLTHNLILLFMCKWLGLSPVDSYRVLGDDLVFTSKRLYQLYLEFADDFQIPISLNKTFVSQTLGEFAGQICWRGFNITPIKWKMLDWNSISTLYWRYRSISTRIAKFMMHGKKAVISLLVLGPLPRWCGGLNLRENDLPKATRSVNQLRCGVLESFREGLITERVSSGVTKIPNFLNPMDVGVFDPLVTPDALRALDTLLVNDSFMKTRWGVLPSLCPNPSKFLSQVGISMNLIPLREFFSLEKGFRMRFRRSKLCDWNTLINLLSTEVSLVDKDKVQSPDSAEEDQPVVTSFFEGTRT